MRRLAFTAWMLLSFALPMTSPAQPPAGSQAVAPDQANASGKAGSRDALELPLWEGGAPESERHEQSENAEDRSHAGRRNRWVTGVSEPTMTVYRPDPATATGAAVCVLPGGGYGGLALDKEGHFVAKWLADRGAVGVVVKYRCGGESQKHPVPLSDARRAIRLVRSHAQEWGVRPDAVGIMGFSAGGHLAATAATQGSPAAPEADDPLERHSSWPDFAVLVYPVVSMEVAVTHGGSRKNLLGDEPSEALSHALSAENRVTSDTPPTLLIHAADDRAVPIENSLRMFAALKEHGVAAELHAYEKGGHGFGMWSTAGSTALWPAALEAWLAARGVVAPRE
ncbi:Acetylxylan esterase precursor [Pseudobythopirellula maris]|uniref:Acetylxylan esterase n=1 Tax=Pseudobythopirellula maris TaxID=2527991 RepID=A0A5C5ZMF0_9BACT|nr:alpha/beta hydrolase [Pseudobythopirellula maris]TWT88276.1 Acetylxylan esterase precursor [Pseudobythopirellula maris]